MNRKTQSNRKSELSPRELELLSVLDKGNCFKKSAEIMGVEETTTRTLAYRAYKKLGVCSLQAALYELRNQNLI